MKLEIYLDIELLAKSVILPEHNFRVYFPSVKDTDGIIIRTLFWILVHRGIKFHIKHLEIQSTVQIF